MAIAEKELAKEEIQKQQTDLEKKSKAMTDDIFNSLDIPAEGLETKEEQEEVEETEETVEASGETTEEEVQEEEAQETEEEGDEELIPKSKVEKIKENTQKRIDQLTKENKELKAKQNKTEEKPSNDSQMQKLEKLSVEQLRDLKKQVRREQVRQTDNDERLDQLIELEEKIDQTIQEAPRKFESSQLKQFHAAVNETASDSEIPNFKEVAPQILETAKNIFANKPSLQRSVTGQAEAWELAVDHFKALSKASAGKDTVKRLNTQVNSLKKKTSLDSNSLKGNQQKANIEKLRQKANHGNSYDKEQYVRAAMNVDDFIPDQFK